MPRPRALLLPRLLLLAKLVSGPFAGNSKLPKLVANHLFGDLHWDEHLAIVNQEAPPYELRQHRRTAGPDLCSLLPPSIVRRVKDERDLREGQLPC